MEYKVIEKNEYGVLVIENDKHKSMSDICSQCKYLENCADKWMECIIPTYYLPDSEIEKLESETDLKAKNDELIKFLEDNIDCCKIPKDHKEPVDTATYSMYIAYNNVLEFIKNQK